MDKKLFINIQLCLFGLMLLFGISLLFPGIGLEIPTGEKGRWFEKIWEIYLVVSNFAGLALMMKDADVQPPPAPLLNQEGAPKAEVVAGEKGFARLSCLWVALLTVSLLFAGCAGQSAQVTTGKTLIAMHDFGMTTAVALDSLCRKQVIKPEPCATIKTAYDKFKASWPIVDDALVVYLKADPSDLLSAKTFQDAQDMFNKDYSELTSLGAQFGVMKGVK